MKRRILAFCLAALMVFGMLPTFAMAEETAGSAATHFAALTAGVTVDGELTETDWLLTGEMAGESGARAYGSLWDQDNLYLAVEPNESDDALTVTVNGTAVTAAADGTVTGAEGAEAAIGTVWEIKIPLKAVGVYLTGYEQTVPLAVAMGGCGWEGTLCLSSSARSRNNRFSGGNVNNMGTAANVGASHDNGTLKFYFKHDESVTSYLTGGYRAYEAQFSTPGMTVSSHINVLEFDFRADKMPEFDTWIGGAGMWVANGFVGGVHFSGPKSASLTFGITNIKDQGLTLVVRTTTGDQAFPLNAGVGENVHVRMEYDYAAKTAELYADDTYLGQAADIRFVNWSSTAEQLLNFNVWSSVQPTDPAYDMDFTVSNITTGNTMSDGVMSYLTFNTIQGANSSTDSVFTDLELVDVLAHPNLGDLELVWSSSDESVIALDGTVTAADTAKTVTLTAALKHDPTVTKEFVLTVSSQAINAYATDETITVDGVLKEKAWILPQTFAVTEGGVTGSAYALISKGNAYIGVNHANAETLTVTLGEKTWDIALTAENTLEGVTAAVTDGVAEVAIDLAAAGIALKDYNEKLAYQLVLTGGDGSASLTAETGLLCFSDRDTYDFDFNINSYLSHAGMVTDSNTLTIQSSDANRRYYGQTNKQPFDRSKGVYLEQVLDIKSMTADGGGNTDALARGYCFWISDGVASSATDTHGYITSAVIWNDNGALKLNVRDGSTTGSYDPIDLGVTVGSGPFVLGYMWNANDTVDVYVNDELKGSVSGVTYLTNYVGNDAVMVNTVCVVDMTVEDLFMVTDLHETVADEITAEAVLGDLDLTAVKEDLPLSDKVFTEILGYVPVRWESSNEAVIAPDGTVTRSDGQDETVTLTLYLAEGTEPLFSVEVTVSASRAIVEAVLTGDPITVDGKLDEPAWGAPVDFTDVEGDVTGKLYAMWGKDTAYLAVEYENATDLDFTIGGFAYINWYIKLTDPQDIEGVTYAIGDGLVEIAVDLNAAGIDLQDYNETHLFQVHLLGSNGAASLDDEDAMLSFSGLRYQRRTLTAGGNTATVVDTNTAKFASDTIARKYLLLGDAQIDHSGDMYLEQTLTISKLESPRSGAIVGSGTSDGYHFLISDALRPKPSNVADKTTYGMLTFVNLWNNNGVLNLKVNDATGTRHDVSLGVGLNETFTLGYLWRADNSAAVYVNGQLKGTVENVGYAAAGAGEETVVINSYAVCDITVTDIGLTTTRHTTVADEITVASVLGGIDLSAVTGDLPLNTTVETPYLGSVNVRWESSNESVIAADGTVTQKMGEDAVVTLTLYLADSTEPLWSVNVTVISATPALSALLATEEITVDGEVTETAWIDFSVFSGTPTDSVASVWNKGMIYFAAASADASSLELVINGKTVTVDLVNGAVSGIEGAEIAVGAVVEIGLPLDALGVSLTDYNQSCPFTATLKGAADNELNAELLIFSGKIAEVQSMAGYSKSGNFSVSGNTAVYDAEQDGSVQYMFRANNPIDHSADLVISKDLLFEKLPVSNGDFMSALQADGYYFWVTDGTAGQNGGSSAGKVVFGTIYNPDNTTLKLKIYKGAASAYETFDLGVKLGEQFRLSMIWGADDTLAIFVNGVLLGTATNVTYNASGCGYDCISFRYYNKGGKTGEDVEFYVSNLSLVKMAYENVLDEITTKAVFGRIDLTHVRRDLPMTDTFETAFFSSLPLTWETSDPSVVAADGTITRGEEAATVTVTLYVEGVELWSVEITVDPVSVTEEPSPSLIQTAFTAAGIVLDGSVSDQGWLLNAKVLDAASNWVGEFGAQWDEENLYLAVDQGDAASVILNVNGIEAPKAETAKSGSVTEYQIALADLDVTADRYNIELPVVVTLDDSSFEGILRLTSIDWWAAGNRESALPVADGQYKTVAYKGGNPTDNQGVVEIENGWHMYDLYDAEGENPVGVRSYVLFMKQDLYNGFNDRTETMYVQFDFQANSLPVYTTESSSLEASAFANYGFTCSLADKANSAKYSNVCVFGIFNTADGLVLAVKRTDVQYISLNKQVGDLFRVGIAWETDGDAVLYIDGEEFCTIDGMSQWLGSVGDCSFVMNTVRNMEEAAGDEDNIDVYITNIAFGKQHSTDVLASLSFEDFAGENESEEEVIYDLELPAVISNGQLSVTETTVTWSSSHPEVIDPETGKVTRPEMGGEIVTLTATLADGSTKSFRLVVIGLNNDSGNVLVAEGDKNPAATAGTVSDEFLFTFDASNNSLIIDLKESQTVNVVKLTDTDAISRINAESLTLWVSEDNASYTRVESFKLLHKGADWYIYDFEATGRYVKVHYTHFDADESDFQGILAEMITAYAEDVFGGNGGEFTETAYTLTNNTGAMQQDHAWTVSKAALGVTGDDAAIRVYLDGQLLYHYVDGDSIIVRIPELAAGSSVELKVLYGADNTMDVSNKENVYEVTYGTRETFRSYGGRWVLSLEKGMTFPDGSVLEQDVLLGMQAASVTVSYDDGYTWKTYASVVNNPGYDTYKDQAGTAIPGSYMDGAGGWIVDWNTGRLMYESYSYVRFSSGDMSQSDCQTVIIFSDDGGKTWNKGYELPQNYEEDPNSQYVLSYSDGVMLSTYDGADGPNVDFVFNMGAQYNNNGSFCGRVAYSRDAGQTWTFSESLITFGNEFTFEGGVSECTILEREDGVLVLYGRCQSTHVDQFAKSYSYDHGVTWTTPAVSSSVYTTNTQPVMMKYDMDGDDVREAALMVWGGNNALGGESYMRVPLNIAESTDGLETFRNIQNLFLETFMETYTASADHYVTNPSAQQINGDGFYVTFARLSHGDTIAMRVDNFVDWFYRTKGIYDSFEHGTAEYEGWETVAGKNAVSAELASDGRYAMEIGGSAKVTRSVPYLQDGVVSMDVYVTGGESFSVELQAAYSDDYNDTAPVGLQVVDGVLTFEGTDSAIALNTGWNTIEFNLSLTSGKASASVNGGSEVALPVNLTAGDYVCYIAINTTDGIYVDDVLVQEAANELPKEEFYGSSMTLGNDLSMNFYIKAEKVPEGAYAEITFKGETKTVQMADLTPENGFYRIVCSGMAAKEMTDEFTVQIFAADGTAVTEARTDSTRAYAMRVLAKEETGAELKTALVDMLNYGAAAQEHFNYKTDDPANNQLTDEQKALATETVEMADKRVKGENYYGSSLALETNIQLAFYFTNVTTDMTAAVTYTDHNGKAVTMDAEVVMNGRYGKVTVEELVVADARQLVSVEITDAEGNVVASASDSVESYCARQANLALREPLMKFAQSAYNQFH